jgi:hypothetical protein
MLRLTMFEDSANKDVHLSLEPPRKDREYREES